MADNLLFFVNEAGEFLLGEQAGKLILAAGALGTAAAGVVDAFKPLFGAAGRGARLAEACPTEWAVYQKQVASDTQSKVLERRISAQLRCEPELVVQDMHDVLTDWLDYGPDAEAKSRTELAMALGWREYGEHRSQLNALSALPTEDSKEPDPAVEERLAQALGARALAFRNLERRLQLGVDAAEVEYGRANRSRAMGLAVVMGVLAGFMSGIGLPDPRPEFFNLDEWLIYVGIGLLAVPLAPVARELAGAVGKLSQATADVVNTVSKRRGGEEP